MYIIYVLVDPRNNKPFYVGKTNSFDSRYSAHICNLDIRTIKTRKKTIERKELIKDIISNGYNVKMIPLFKNIPECTVNKFEHITYQLLKAQGYNLLQAQQQFNSK
jgi:hypothetical protein